jgi:hypothetical protein
MIGHPPKIARGVGVVTLAMAPMLVAAAGAFGLRQRQCFAQLGGRLVEGFHNNTLRPAGEEVKR